MDDEALLVTRADGILRLTINRPEQRNALTLDLLGRIGAALDESAGAQELKLAVITAAGDRCFAAGGDLKELDAVRSPAQTLAMSRHGRRALDAVRAFPLPVLAALNGHALGGGAELAMACDFRVATAATRIGFLQAGLAVTTAWGGGIDLVHALGSTGAQALLLEARQVDAPEALALGLLQRVCGPDESLDACAAAFLAPLLARPRQVLAAFKALAAAPRRALHAALAAQEEAGFVETWTHPDHWEAVARSEAARRKRQDTPFLV
jgi:enoyl-CoA hydratase